MSCAWNNFFQKFDDHLSKSGLNMSQSNTEKCPMNKEDRLFPLANIVPPSLDVFFLLNCPQMKKRLGTFKIIRSNGFSRILDKFSRRVKCRGEYTSQTIFFTSLAWTKNQPDKKLGCNV